MALEFARGFISWSGALGVLGTVHTVSGLSFQPKAIRFTTNGLGSTINLASQAGNILKIVGFAVSTTERRAVAALSVDGGNSAVCRSVSVDDCIALTITSAGAIEGKLDLQSITSDGFTLVVDAEPTTTSTGVVFWEAWGGSDITVAAVGEFAEPLPGGDVDYAVTGFTAAGTDQVVLFAGVQANTAINTVQSADSGLYMGYASGASDQWVHEGNNDDGSGTMDADNFMKSGRCVGMIDLGGGDNIVVAALTQFNTDGFRLNWSLVSGRARRSIFLAIKGGNWKAGVGTIASNTLNATMTVSGLSFAPKGLLAGTRDQAENGTEVSGATGDKMMWGSAASTSDRGALGLFDETATTSAECNTVVRYDAILAGPTNAGALDWRIDVNAFNSDGFELIVDETGAVASVAVGYLTFGDAAAGGDVTGTGALSAQAATADGTGISSSTGTGALAAQAATVEGTGTVEDQSITGTGALAAQAATLDGTGTSSSAGTGALVAQAATADGTGTSSSTGTGTLAAQAAALDGAGTGNSTGTGALSAQASTLDGTGASSSTGTGVLAAQASTLDGVGVSASTGTGALMAQSATVSGSSGLATITGAGALVAQSATADGAGASASTGAGTLAAQASTLDGTATSASVGAGVLVVQDVTVDGTGVSASAGTGALAAQAAAADGAGISGSTGTGALAVDPATIAGTDAGASVGVGLLVAQAASLAGVGAVADTAHIRVRVPSRSLARAPAHSRPSPSSSRRIPWHYGSSRRRK